MKTPSSGLTPSYESLTGGGLVENWRRIVTRDRALLKDALASLNKATGKRYLSQHIGRMISGARAPRPETIDYMMRAVLPELFKDCGLDPNLARDICEQLRISVEKEGDSKDATE